MNYIAHLAIAEHTATDLVGALLGDFVKGSDMSQYSTRTQQAVWLHRKVDSFTDGTDQLSSIKRSMPTELRRFAAIGLDVYFDHLLLSHWFQFHRFEIGDLFDRFYQGLQQYQGHEPESFIRVKQGLLARRWLSDYEHRETCLRALYRVEARLRRRHSFAANLYDELAGRHDEIERAFIGFYPGVLERSREWVAELEAVEA